VSFQEHDETIGGVHLSDNESKNSSTQPNSSKDDDQLPSAAELAAAKKQAELKATIHAKLAESLKQRKELDDEGAKVIANFQERKARRVEEEEVKRQTWDTCPNNWGTLVDENGERIKRPAYKALMKKLAEGNFPDVDPTAAPKIPAPSKMFAPPPPNSQRKVSCPETEASKEARAVKGDSGMGFADTRRTEQLAQSTNRVPSMAPANSNFRRPSAGTLHQATTNNRTQHNTASPATYNTRISQTGMSIAVVQQEPMIENTRPGQMVVAAPRAPTIRFDAPIEAFEQWAAQNFRG
jgi:hypothetical protein